MERGKNKREKNGGPETNLEHEEEEKMTRENIMKRGTRGKRKGVKEEGK